MSHYKVKNNVLAEWNWQNSGGVPESGVSQQLFFPTLKLATAAYDYDELGGTGPFNLPLTVPIPKGSFITGIMFDIHTIPTPDTNF